MAERISASYLTGPEAGGRLGSQPLSLSAQAGDAVFLQGSQRQRSAHFAVLCGLEDPDMGTLFVDGLGLHALDRQARADFRRERIGGIPAGGGLLPEAPMLEQVLLPLLLKGMDWEEALERLEALLPSRLTRSDLRRSPRKSPAWKIAYASVLRLLLQEPEVLVLDGTLDDLEELDADALWSLLLEKRRADSVLIYLSGGPAPRQVTWERTVRL